jgi:VIT1/CCC1 family predicted Fe2+/Mn2+ transporter
LARFAKDPANQEAAVVDSLIRKLRPFDKSYGSERASTIGARPLSRMRPIRAPMSAAAVWSCVGLGVLLGAALPQWPYARACGSWLGLYMVAVGTVVVAGIWGARVSWKSRLGLAHVIAVGTIIWGLALTAQEVLPRIGYAKARLAWRCYDGHAAESSATRLAAVKPRADGGMVDLAR